MSFLKKIKSALGLSSEQEYDDPPLVIEKMPTEPPKIETDEPLEVHEDIMINIFDKVVEVTNESLPGYLSESVNAEKQKKYLFDALDQSVKQYLADLDAKSQAKCMALWQSERDELNLQMQTLKQRAADLEARRNEVNEQKLSSENQRRALTERVKVLEAKVLSLEAEKEQYEIENRGLINKVKVVQVYESDMEAMRLELEQLRAAVSPEAAAEEVGKLQSEIAALQEEITRLRNGSTESQNENDRLRGNIDGLNTENGNLQSKIAGLQTEIKGLQNNNGKLTNEIAALQNEIDGMQNDNSKLTNEITGLQNEITGLKDNNGKLRNEIAGLRHHNVTLTESCEAAKVKSGMSDAMIKDLQKRTSELVQTVKEAEQTHAELSDELAVKDAKIADLHQIIEEKDARLAEDENMFEEFEMLSEQINMFEEVKNRLEDKISKLKGDLKEARKENDTLRTTIKTNLYSHAEQERVMKETIDHLRSTDGAPLSSEDLSIDSDTL